VGRPNVGKSTLFNRLLGRKRALVHNQPGVTRDRMVEAVEWIVGGLTYRVELVDTGGVGGENFTQEINQQVDLALEGSQAVLFVTDSREGPTDADREVLQKLRKAHILDNQLVIGIANKCDTEKHEAALSEFYSLSLDYWLPVSAEHARGIEDLKDLLVREAGLTAEQGPSDVPIPIRDWHQIAIVGRPNVGKSTF